VLRLQRTIARIVRLALNVLRPNSWRLLVTRGDHFVVAFGRLYVRSESESAAFGTQIAATFDGPGRRGTLFVLWPSRPTAEKRVDGLNPALVISGLGRFGNSILQIANAVELALHLKDASIVFFPSRIVRTDFTKSSSGLSLRRHQLRSLKGTEPPKALWRSDFIEGWPNPVRLSDECAAIMRADVLPSLSVPRVGRQRSRSALTIHLRSGDVYDENPHPAYGQPPLSFYEEVIKRQKWGEVRLVAEDQTSPCWDGIVQACAAGQVPVRLLGQSLAEALKEIGESTNLVASRGTFIPAILFLFPKTRRVYTFGRDFSVLDAGDGLEIVECDDVGQHYTQSNLSDNWSNSVSQRELMLTYPAGLLNFSTRTR
jgi:hypothetical protein